MQRKSRSSSSSLISSAYALEMAAISSSISEVQLLLWSCVAGDTPSLLTSLLLSIRTCDNNKEMSPLAQSSLSYPSSNKLMGSRLDPARTGVAAASTLKCIFPLLVLELGALPSASFLHMVARQKTYRGHSFKTRTEIFIQSHCIVIGTYL